VVLRVGRLTEGDTGDSEGLNGDLHCCSLWYCCWVYINNKFYFGINQLLKKQETRNYELQCKKDY
jgi:hypothetical protein